MGEWTKIYIKPGRDFNWRWQEKKGEVEKATNRTGGKRDPPIETTTHGCKAKSNKGGEGDQRRTRKKLPTKPNMSTCKNLDDEFAR